MAHWETKYQITLLLIKCKWVKLHGQRHILAGWGYKGISAALGTGTQAPPPGRIVTTLRYSSSPYLNPCKKYTDTQAGKTSNL